MAVPLYLSTRITDIHDMIKINLLPFKRKRASTLTKDIRDLILALIVVLSDLEYMNIVLYNEIEEQKTNIKAKKQEMKVYNLYAQEYKQIQEAKKR